MMILSFGEYKHLQISQKRGRKCDHKVLGPLAAVNETKCATKHVLIGQTDFSIQMVISHPTV